jgi:GTP pyrophosphokinase
VIGPFGERIEIQIRTTEMDQVANSGIAAHWSYKEGKRGDDEVAKTYAWVRNIVENQKNFKDPNEFLENVRIDLFPDDIYVFTPQGEIKSMPKGATPVDFAYMIHTEVGNQCTGSKVNGRMVPLRYELQTGEIVEVITTKDHTPSKDWLNFVKTVKARSKIRQWIKTQEKERSLSLGKEMCEKAFKKYRLNFTSVVKSDEMLEVVAHFGFKSNDDLIASVGYGKITPLQIIRRLQSQEEQKEEEPTSIITKIVGRVRRRRNREGVVVKGLDDILVRFGKCCQPVPGDPIVGYITRGQGVTVHRTSCINALKMTPERQIDVDWDVAVADTYPVKIFIKASDRMGLLADVTSKIAQSGANILSINTTLKEDKAVDINLKLSVTSIDQLTRLLATLRKIKLISEVKRIG